MLHRILLMSSRQLSRPLAVLPAATGLHILGTIPA
jgi:hypothetical protein